MATSPAEAMQDAHEERHAQGREVELGCDQCGECWLILVPEGEDITYEQTICPDNSCDGEGEEL
jgi:hypothetical protein